MSLKDFLKSYRPQTLNGSVFPYSTLYLREENKTKRENTTKKKLKRMGNCRNQLT